MSTRRELPWNLIHSDVDRAARTFCKGDFLATKHITEDILAHSEDYPHLVNARYSSKCVTSRVTVSARKRGWVEWTSGKCTGSNRVFVIPREKVGE